MSEFRFQSSGGLTREYLKQLMYQWFLPLWTWYSKWLPPGSRHFYICAQVKTGKHEPPEILEPLQSYVVREGETVLLSTQIVGNPAPKVTWYKNGKPLKGLTPKQDGHVNTLTLIQPQVSDSGDYSVVATNDLGTAETKATLTVESKNSIEYSLQKLLTFCDQCLQCICILFSKKLIEFAIHAKISLIA